MKKFTRSEIYDAIITLTDSAGVKVGQREIALVAAEKYIKRKADFRDYMILTEGENNGSSQLITFDQIILTEISTTSLPGSKRK